ncbi:MAG: tRNA uridine-5-carboxymethylaminomethyl(34) synthesis GTPase MnmE [Mycoplasmataceae bacterium]|jgi:tRNA modification GTPase|nr:tRNA uridine-5-carboxymethylaminomethyl(34) synthesis GTPase MnmE [Mycoplasmataceae bacterium]
MITKNNTIVALATPPMNCAIHIIRISGCKAYEIINKICDEKITKVGYSVQRTNIKDDKQIIDNVLLIKFLQDKSFTGEDTIEINCHGGFYLANKIIKLLIKNGCRLANPGEFSQRAYMNKKINLIQAESINNLIKSTNDYAINVANNGISEETKKKIINFKNILFKLIGQIEVNIDYPEYDDVPNITKDEFINNLNKIINESEKIINESEKIIPFINGVNIAIIGKPNVGKSSIYNLILKENKSIISDVPGTTRDCLDTTINFHGITITFVDTAGIRKSNNKIEKIGIEKTTNSINKSDIVLFVYDANKIFDTNDKKILDSIKNKKIIIIANKIDLGIKKLIPKSIPISVAKKQNIEKLSNEIINAIKPINMDYKNTILLQSKQEIDIMKKIKNNLLYILKIIKNNNPIDLANEYLHEAFDDVLLLLGEKNNYDFINNLFKKFCIGK